MILVLGECRHNYKKTTQLHRDRFPDRRYPSDRMIRNCELRARRGNLCRHQHKLPSRFRDCNTRSNGYERDPFFFSYVLFSDEVTFKNSGELNPLIPIFTAGPYFFDGTLIGECYNNFLIDELQGLLEDVPLGTRLGVWFHHDDAPAHNDRVRRMLNSMFPGR
ncbi:hypothetical protein WH47_07636 [Habropoda laboriosa]|uniref:Uncharacterized protein n=1 Tax=Habropoda laboriosa TaxID=597456 RepID=A0A0L7RED2_9HYME|nr:hypothetical protein WH47_07636 [Habropoda laboriosa]